MTTSATSSAASGKRWHDARRGFTINAGYGDSGTKAAFDEDGLNMSWTLGDVLYMIDPNRAIRLAMPERFH